MDKLGNGGKGIAWNTEHEVEPPARLNGVVLEEGPTKGMPRSRPRSTPAEVILMLAPETNGEVAVKAWEALGKTTGRDHAHLAAQGGREDPLPRRRRPAAQDHLLADLVGLESEKVCYNAGYTNVHELIPWRTLTGRQQLYQDHLWMRAFGEASASIARRSTSRRSPVIDRKPNGNKQVVLNFITPHQKWGIHSTYTDNLLMLTLSRGGPIVWISEVDAKKAGIVDNDWIEAYNTNGALVARAVVSQRIKEGTCFMYHAQEKIVNTPGSEMTGKRGGIHNSVTRAVLKPTHMIGGYAQQSYGFNYYGTVGTNRDEFVIVRKMAKRSTGSTGPPTSRPAALEEAQNEDPRANRHGAEPRQVHRLPHLLGHLQERVDQPRRRGIRLVQQRRDQARHRLSQGLGEPEALERRLGAQARTARSSRASAASGACWRTSSPIPTCPRSTTTTSPSPSTTSTCRRRRSWRRSPPRARAR
jgi:nitrate reductase / nitrite oxidoreductase, alpha subunit